MKSKTLLILFILLLPGTNWGGNSSDFDHLRAPSKQTWQYFLQIPDSDRGNLWLNKSTKGVGLKDWSWQWRLAWVRSCSESTVPYCLDIISSALRDKALVVRAESARAIGLRARNTGDSKALASLAFAYQNPKNHRRNKPLFIQFHILRAILEVGGPNASPLGLSLATSHPKTLTYWQTLTREPPPS